MLREYGIHILARFGAVYERQPERVFPIGRDAIRETRQIVYKDIRFSFSGSSEPVALHPILTSLYNQNERLIGANRNAIGKIKLIEHQPRSFGAWVIGKQTTIGPVLH